MKIQKKIKCKWFKKDAEYCGYTVVDIFNLNVHACSKHIHNLTKWLEARRRENK